MPGDGGGAAASVTFGMFGGSRKRDPQQMARVPLFLITIVRRRRRAALFSFINCILHSVLLVRAIAFAGAVLGSLCPAFFFFCSLHSVL